MRVFAVAALLEPPFPARINQYAAQVARESTRWATEFGLVSTSEAMRRLADANPADLAGRACPDAPPERLRLLSDLVAWLFAFDDQCDDDDLGDDPSRLAPVVSQLLDVLDLLGGAAPPELLATAGPAGAGLHDLCRRIRAQGRPWLLLRFAAQLRDYLLAMLWEAANRERRRVPALAEYLQMRRHTGGVRPSLTLTELAYGGRLDPARYAEPAMFRLDNLATDLICWCNDVFSYDKERRIGRDGHNLVVVLARDTGRTERAALADAADRFNAGLRAYLRLEADLPGGDDPEVARFVAARRCWIRATYDWSLGATRYH